MMFAVHRAPSPPRLAMAAILLLVLAGAATILVAVLPGHATPTATPAPVPAAATTTAAPTTVATSSPTPSPAPAPRTGLAQAAVTAAQGAAARSTQLGVVVLDRRTGELAVGRRGTEPFYTASLSKVVVAVDVFDRHRLSGLAITTSDLALFARALGASDDSAMNALWSRFDGAGAARRVAARIGLTGTRGPSDPSQWGEMLVPANDMVRLWQYILTDMPAADRDVLIGDLRAAPPVSRDGFDQAYGLLEPDIRAAGPTIAKQGWMCCFSSIYYLHSTGTVGPDQRFVVALLSRVPRSGGWETARQELDRIADATVHALS